MGKPVTYREQEKIENTVKLRGISSGTSSLCQGLFPGQGTDHLRQNPFILCL